MVSSRSIRFRTSSGLTPVLLAITLLFAVGCDDTVSATSVDASADGIADAGVISPPAPVAGFMPVDPARSCPSPAPEWHCLTPWPSDFHRAQKPSGVARLILPAKGVPTTEDGERVDWITPFERDGVGILPQIIAHIPGGVDDTNLIGPEDNYDLSMVTKQSPTLLIDTVTGKSIAHFAEIDPVPKHVDNRGLILRPLQPLQWGRRYVVVLQRLRRPGGAAISRSPTFDRIFSEKATDSTWEQQQQAYYKAFIHPTLTATDVQPDDVTLAWDFTTATSQNLRGRIQTMAKDARTQIAAGLFGEVTITSMKSGSGNDETAWWIRGEIELPAYVSKPKHPSPHMTTNATTSFKLPFGIMVSRAAVKLLAQGKTPGIIIMGHGFFGDEGELLAGGYRHAAQASGAVAIGISWWGLSKGDAAPVIGSLVAKLAPLRFLADRMEQGLVNVVALAALTRRPPGQQKSPGKQKSAGKRLTDLTLPGSTTPIIQPSGRLSYYGASLGHILGTAAVALSPDIERAAVQVGGANWGMIMPRSQPFGGLLAILAGRFSDQGQTLLATLHLAEILSSVDPGSWGPELSQLPTGEERPLLLHAGPGDASVPVMAAEFQARSLGLPLLTPAPRKVWGLSELPMEGASRGLVEVDFGVPNPAVKAIPPNEGTKVHNGMRGLKAVRAQVGMFLSGELIPAACSGVCDPN